MVEGFALPDHGPYRVVVTDLDHTLFPQEEEVLPAGFPRLIRRWRTRGRSWILATGRTVGDLKKFYRTWPVWPDYTVARERFIIQHVGRTWFPFREWNHRMMERTLVVNHRSPEWINRLVNEVNDRDEFSKVEKNFVVFHSVNRAQRWEDWLQEQLPDGLEPLRNRGYLALRPPKIGKGRCLLRILRARRWKAKEILAVGDSANDRDMLDGRYGFYPVAVNNAEQAVKDWVLQAGGTVLKETAGKGAVRLFRHLTRRNQATRAFGP